MSKPATDHLGKNYTSVAAMCKAYGVDRATYNRRLKQGWTQERALTTPARVYKGGLTEEEKKARTSAYNKEYRNKNIEKEVARVREYRETHREEIKATTKRYNETHKDKIKAYREANKESMKVYQKAYREANKEKMREYQKKYRAEMKARKALEAEDSQCPIE